LIDRFMKINDIEVYIDQLIETLDSSPTLTICKQIRTRMDSAQRQTDSLLALIKHGLTDLTHFYNDETITFHDYNTLFYELNEMMAAISSMSIKVDDVEERLTTLNHEYISILAGSVAPAFQCFTEGVKSDLQTALEKGQLSKERFRHITGEHNNIFSEKINTVVAQQLEGLQSHYMELMVENHQLITQGAGSSQKDVTSFFAPENPVQDGGEKNNSGAYIMDARV